MEDRQMPRKIAVAGATGRVGRHIVEVLTERGHEVVPIARSAGVDVITGAGLAGALTGVTTIVDAATGPSPEQWEATDFFTTAARNLHQAGQGRWVSDPADPGYEINENGGLLPGPDAILAGPTFDEWLNRWNARVSK
jgi:uncharacterized protein YbjT (DUF2867 family)